MYPVSLHFYVSHIRLLPPHPLSLLSGILHRLLLFRRPIPRLSPTTSPALRRPSRSLILHRHAAATLRHLPRLLNHIGSVRERLPEIADRADDVFVAVHAEGDDGDEAEGEPGVVLYDARGVVALW